MVFVALLVYLVLYEGPGRRGGETEKAETILDIEAEKVTRVTLHRGDTTLVAMRDGAGWQITAPVSTAGDRGNLNALVRSAGNIDRVGVVADSAAVTQGEVALADFGLAEPDVVVVLERGEGKVDTLYWGDKSPTGSYAYLRRSGGPEILTTSAWRKAQFDKGLFHLRERRVVPFELEEARKLEIKHGGREVVAAVHDGAWRLERPVGDRGDEPAIIKVLNRLRSGKATRFAAEEAADLAPYGLDDPWLTVTVYVGEGMAQKTLVVGGKIREGRFLRYYGKYLPRRPIFTVDSAFVASVKKMPSDLRYKEIFEYEREGVDRLVLAYADSTVECEWVPSGGAWVVRSPRHREVLNSEVEGLLDRVRDLKAKRFVAESLEDPVRYGLDRPVLDLRIWKAGELVRAVTLGEGDKTVYVVGDARPQVVELDMIAAGNLRLELLPVGPGATDAKATGGGSLPDPAGK